MASPKGNRYAADPTKRKRGQNKINRETKELLRKFVDDNFDTAIKEWESIEDKGLKVKLFIQFLPYAAPRLNSVTVQDAHGTNLVRELLEQQSK